MKNMTRILTLVAVVLAVSLSAFAQSQPTVTTISSAIPDGRATIMRVASATGFTASNQSAATDYYAMIDREMVRITAVSSTTISIQRGQFSTSAQPHKSGAHVIVGLGPQAQGAAIGQSGGPFVATVFSGSCTASSYPVLPLISVNPNALGGQVMYDCNNGQWATQTLLDDPGGIAGVTGAEPTRSCTPPALNVLALLTSFGNSNFPLDVGTNQTPVAGTVYYGTMVIQKTAVLTGLSVLNGLVAGTDNLILALYRADGVRVATTALAGATASGAGRFQDIALTTPYLATGPARYWVAVQSNGTTTRFRTVPLTPGSSTAGLGAFIGMLGSSFTGTFATLPALTASTAASNPGTTALPTSLIANTAPVMCAY